MRIYELSRILIRMKPNPHHSHIPGTTYLVGGAVRDTLLKYPSHEKDYVVVGATPEQMLQAGFLPVGKSFPVFLHPNTKEEYALARSEKKVAKGYHGFEFHADPSVTLEEDLMRRDLTINAMAMDAEGNLTDPYHGKQDLDNRVLRHVSDAFIEDPVRILRIARFAARFHHLGFTVAPETMTLMKTMVENGEVDALVPERVWKESEKAFDEKNPEIYIQVLQACGALRILMPELDEALKTRQHERFAALHQAVVLTEHEIDPVKGAIRFATLTHGITFRSPNIPPHWLIYLDMFNPHEAELTVLNQLNAEQLLNLLNALDAFRRNTRFQSFLVIIHALYGESAATHLNDACIKADAVSIQKITQEHTGLAIKKEIHAARVKAIDDWLNSR